MSDKKVSITVPFPLFALLFVLFLGLKLTGKIAWSWWLVFSPLWGPPAVAAALFVVIFLIMLLVGVFKKA